MSTELVNKVDDSIFALDLKDGQIAVTTAWIYNKYVGSLVQRYKDDLICIGQDNTQSWKNVYNIIERDINTVWLLCKVRVLKDGELIKVTNNQ